MPIRVLVYGLGPIGSAVARQVVARKGFALVGAVDTDRDKVGQDVAAVIGLAQTLRIRVSHDAVGGTTPVKPDSGGDVHHVLAEEGAARHRHRAEAEDAARLDHGGAVLSRGTESRPGDIATASIAVNAVPQMLRVAPGLRTMIDMPIVSYRAR